MGLKLRGMVEVMGEKVLPRYKIPLSKGPLQTANLALQNGRFYTRHINTDVPVHSDHSYSDTL